MTSTTASTAVAPVDRNAVIPEVIIWTASEALPVRANKPTLLQHSERLPEHGAFFVRQSDKFIGSRVCCRVISAEASTIEI